MPLCLGIMFDECPSQAQCNKTCPPLHCKALECSSVPVGIGILVSVKLTLVRLFSRPSNPDAVVPPEKDAAYVLLGQADALTDSTFGSANFSGLIVTAAPGEYRLNFTVPQYKQVLLNLTCH